MKIGVIGTGNIGGTLARKLSAAGHDVRVANSRGLEGVRAFADEIGATAIDTRGAVEGADVIVISIPFPAVAELPKDLFDTVPQDVPVVDTGNYYPGMRDTQIAEIDAGMPQSVWVSKQLGRPVIKGLQQHPGALAELLLTGHNAPASIPAYADQLACRDA
jgi:8-hydroxy-5-deazaflavin:NADPH oxidoreductase